MFDSKIHKNNSYKCISSLNQMQALGEPLMFQKMEILDLPAAPQKMSKDEDTPNPKDDMKETDVCFVPSKVKLSGTLVHTPEARCGFTSILMKDSARDSLEKVKDVLVRNGTEIFHLDVHNFILKGLLLVKNEPISLRATVWAEGRNSRVQFKRTQGSPILFHMVYEVLREELSPKTGERLEFQHTQIEKEKETEESNLAIGPLESSGYYCDCDYDSSSGAEFSCEYGDCYEDEQLQAFADDINNDDYQLETLSLVLNCVPKEKLHQHDALISAIQNCLNSTDLAVKKVAEKILSQR